MSRQTRIPWPLTHRKCILDVTACRSLHDDNGIDIVKPGFKPEGRKSAQKESIRKYLDLDRAGPFTIMNIAFVLLGQLTVVFVMSCAIPTHGQIGGRRTTMDHLAAINAHYIDPGTPLEASRRGVCKGFKQTETLKGTWVCPGGCMHSVRMPDSWVRLQCTTEAYTGSEHGVSVSN